MSTSVPVITPHFAYPWSFSAADGAAVVEQDSIDEIFSCVEAVVACPIGAWSNVPAFGIPQQLYAAAPIDPTGIENAIVRWEPRAATVAREYPDLMSDAIRHIQIEVSPAQADQ